MGPEAFDEWVLERIDILEPEGFEEWVLEQLRAAGYDTWRTPRSGDRGADGLAVSGAGAEQHTIVVQCKHTQPDDNCGRAAVEEVLGSIPAYKDAIQGKALPMVVTNAADFTNDAVHLAKQEGVQMIARDRLRQLQTWK